MKREPRTAMADETTDRSEHIKSISVGRARQQTHELRTVVVDPTVDPRKALTMRKLSKPGEAPQPWRAGDEPAARAPRTVGGSTMQVPTVGSKTAPAELPETGGVAESIAAHKLKARRTVKIDETAPLPPVVPKPVPPSQASSAYEVSAEPSPGIDVPPPSGIAPDPRLLAEVTPPGPMVVRTKTSGRKRAQTPTPLGLGPVAANVELEDAPHDLEDDKITRPLRPVPQELAEADTRRLPTVPRSPTAAAPVTPPPGFPWPVAAATCVAVLALIVYLMFLRDGGSF